VESFAPSTVKKSICGNGRASKEKVKMAASFSAELKDHLSQYQQCMEKCRCNVFDAVTHALFFAEKKRF
jgi:Holliday junction resolvasome RuvABC endonuclease subunit